jgi:ubiquinone/menaquinone biosynthesis C-methylase UbiE
MISELFEQISRWSPSLKRWMWWTWYDLLAYACRDPGWTFMNFGYQDSNPAIEPLPLFQADEPDRSAIQLYHHALGAVDLRDRDVLEMGCGRGGGCWYLSRYFEPRSVTGLDLSQKVIALCCHRYAGTSLSFRQGDAEAMPFADRAFDVVINVESSHCYLSMQRAMSEVFRVLRVGGHFVFADLHPAEQIPTLREQLGSAGLRWVKEEIITANVLAALNGDHERKRALIREKIPRLFRAQFQQFAGLRDSAIYHAIRERRVEYVSYVLRKEA